MLVPRVEGSEALSGMARRMLQTGQWGGGQFVELHACAGLQMPLGRAVLTAHWLGVATDSYGKLRWRWLWRAMGSGSGWRLL